MSPDQYLKITLGYKFPEEICSGYYDDEDWSLYSSNDDIFEPIPF